MDIEKSTEIMQRKNITRRFLVDRDMTAIENLAAGNTNIFRALSSMLYDDDPLVRWRAIEGLGAAAKIIGKSNLDKVRRQVRRILWLMNDESGGLCWNGPEAIAEIIFNIPELIDEYGAILSSFLREEPFEAGTRRALARIGLIDPGVFNDSKGILIDSLASVDPEIRGTSIKALIALGDSSAGQRIKSMREDTAVFENYNFSTGKLETLTISHLADIYLSGVNLQIKQS